MIPNLLNIVALQVTRNLHFVTVKNLNYGMVCLTVYSVGIKILNVRSIDEAENISKFVVDDGNYTGTINWKIVNTHKTIRIPKLLLENIQNFIQPNYMRYVTVQNVPPPNEGTCLRLMSYSRPYRRYIYTGGKFGIIFDILTGKGYMSCSVKEQCESKLQEFITLFFVVHSKYHTNIIE